MSDPVIGFPLAEYPLMPGGESTGAQLSQARIQIETLNAEHGRLSAQVGTLAQRLDEAWAENAELQKTLAASQADLSRVETELASWRAAGQNTIAQAGWVVARTEAGVCPSCAGMIRRGHAVEPIPDAKGWWQHVHCPNPERP